MKTAIDTNIILDILLPDPKFGWKSRSALNDVAQQGSLVVSEVVYSELAAFFETKRQLEVALEQLEIEVTSFGREAAYLSGFVWKNYRKSGGSRQRVLADFMIAAHAQVHADRLLTRDRGFYRKYFRELTILEP